MTKKLSDYQREDLIKEGKHQLYVILRQLPPEFEVVDDAREVVINIVSCMCDNKHKITLKKNQEGDFKMHGHGFALSNYSMKHDIDDIEWQADVQDWATVFDMINSGTSAIHTIKSR